MSDKLEEREAYNGVLYHPETEQALREVIDKAMKNQTPVRIFYGDAGKVWSEENDVYGRFGRSTGPAKIPLLVEFGELGGPALLDHRIVFVLQRPHGKGKPVVIYRKEGYEFPKFTVIKTHTVTEYITYKVLDEELNEVAAFPEMVEVRSAEKYADNWVKFMQGEELKLKIRRDK